MMVRCFFISLCNKSQDHVRVSPIVLYYALYLHMWRAKMKKWCSNNFSFCSSNCQNATVAFHSTLFNQIKNWPKPTLFSFSRFISLSSFFFFFFLSLFSHFLQPALPFPLLKIQPGVVVNGLGLAWWPGPGFFFFWGF